MRNLKKILALVLALVMSMSLVSVASADFADAGEINNDQAVNALYSLGVIDGVGGNKFNPTGKVTRAQMAKMITIISLGNVDVTAFKGTKTDLTDVAGHWAEGYINYCYSQGIIAGKGAGVFAPDANVKAAEAAKMLLVAIGYNAQVQGYVGTGDQWSINVARDAQLSGFYKNVAVAAETELTRDQAAQMIYNAIDTGIVEATPNWNSSTGAVTYEYTKKGDTEDLLKKTFDVDTIVGKLVGNTYNAETGKYTYYIDTNAAYDENTQDASFTSTEDYTALYLQNVKVLSSDKTGSVVLYGIYSNKGGVVVSAPYVKVANGSSGTETIKVDGVAYKTRDNDNNYADETYYKVMYNYTPGTGTPDAEDVVSFIDYDGDAKIDYAVFTPVVYETVQYVGTKSYTVTNAGSALADPAPKFSATDVKVYDGIAKDDKVAIVAKANTFNNVAVISKLTVETGKVVATNGSKVQIGDNWYTKGAGVTANLGSSYKYAVVNDVIVYSTPAGSAKTTAADYVILTAVGTDDFGTNMIKVLKSDGTTETLNYDAGVTSQIAFASLVVSDVLQDDIYNIKDADKDGKYELYAVETTDVNGDGNVGGFDGAGTSTAVSSKKIGANAIADDAIVFNKNASGKYSVTTGAELKKTTATVTNFWYDTNDATGFSTVVLAYVKGTTLSSTSDLKYGYVTSDIILEKNADNNTIAKVTFWDGTATQTLYTDTSNATALLKKGEAFKYKLDSKGNMTNVSAYGSVAENTVMAWDPATGEIKFTGGTVYTVNNDTVIIYVDTANKAGVEGGSIALATKKNGIDYDKNVISEGAVVNSKNVVTVLFVDVANDFTWVDPLA